MDSGGDALGRPPFTEGASVMVERAASRDFESILEMCLELWPRVVGCETRVDGHYVHEAMLQCAHAMSPHASGTGVLNPIGTTRHMGGRPTCTPGGCVRDARSRTVRYCNTLAKVGRVYAM